jgi:HEAT repeat protein
MAQADSINSIQQAPLIISHLTNVTDNEIRLACLKALGKVNDSTLVSQIIQTSAHFRPSERRLTEAIISQMGLKTVPTLLALTKDISMPDRCRVLAGRILGHLSLPQLRANLSEIIRQEIERAYFYFFYSHTIQSNYPHLDLKMLSDVLMTGYHSVINFIIQLLGVSGEIEDAELLSRSIRSRNPKVRSQVVEALEKTAETPIFRLMQPLVDELPHQEKIQAYLNLKRKSLSLTDLLDTMTQSSSQIDRIIAATIKHQLNVPNWRESLRQQMLQHDEIFHHFAYELLDA